MFNSKALKDRLNRFPGSHECHITVSIKTEKFPLFKKKCKSFDAKSLIINLDGGKTPIQPMLCKQYKGDENKTHDDISNIFDMLSKDFIVERVKVEASLNNIGIPKTTADIIGLPDDCYFENHIKLSLPLDKHGTHLREELKKYDGHLSRNPLSKQRKFEQRFVTQRFVTQRFYKCTFQEAENRLVELVNYLKKNSFNIVQIIQEFNIYDSNVLLDSGWIENE